MIVLTIRTDKPEAELGLFDGTTKRGYVVWYAHRKLSLDIHHKIESLLAAAACTFQDVQGIVCFAGPGSFTGLRIGLTVGNVLAYAQQIPVVATMGEDWIDRGIARLQAGEQDAVALPHYGSEAHITLPRVTPKQDKSE